MNRSMLIVFTIGLFGLAGCANAPSPVPSPSRTQFLLQGTITTPMDFETHARLFDRNPEVGDSCWADIGYDDIAQGAQVVVDDEGGKTVATGTLGNGEVWIAGGALIDPYCQFPITVYNFPEASSFYSVHVGNTFRGEVTYTLEQLKAGLTLRIP